MLLLVSLASAFRTTATRNGRRHVVQHIRSLSMASAARSSSGSSSRLAASDVDTPVEQQTLYDMPVSNHGARVRHLLYEKGLGSDVVNIVAPAALGGLTSADYIKLNPMKKMPLLVLANGYAIAESDSICRFLLDKHSNKAPSFVPTLLEERILSEQICRIHDQYMSSLQGCMYKQQPFVFSTHGNDRIKALHDFLQQWRNIEALLASFDALYSTSTRAQSSSSNSAYITGGEISLADVTLFPTYIFAQYMLPKFFNISEQQFAGPLLRRWADRFSKQANSSRIRSEIEEVRVCVNMWV